MQSEQINELAAALSKAQAEIKGAEKDSSNPFFKSSYADLESVWSAIREPLAKNNLSVIQTMDTDDKGDFVVTTLAHSSGQWIRGRTRLITLKGGKEDMQNLGSGITYARRYALAEICGVYQTDDDANIASGKTQQKSDLNAEYVKPEVGSYNPNFDQDDLAGYQIKVGEKGGKLHGKTFGSIGKEQLKVLAQQAQTMFANMKKEPSKDWMEFFLKAEQYINEGMTQ